MMTFRGSVGLQRSLYAHYSLDYNPLANFTGRWVKYPSYKAPARSQCAPPVVCVDAPSKLNGHLADANALKAILSLFLLGMARSHSASSN